MAFQVKSKEELEKELVEKNQKLAVSKNKVQELSKELGIEPKEEKISEELKSLDAQEEEFQSQIDSLLKEIESIEAGYQETEEVPEESPAQSTVSDEFED